MKELVLIAGLMYPVEVDVELVLAADISGSMSTEEKRIQREAYSNAFKNRDILDAIRSGMLGKIAVTYVEWAEGTSQRVEWSIIEDESSMVTFSNKIASMDDTYLGQGTQIDRALNFGLKLIDGNSVSGLKRVIDISGDGIQSTNTNSLKLSRKNLLLNGVTVNGLAMDIERNAHDIDLKAYFEDCVRVGPTSFVVKVDKMENFQQALEMKLRYEIAGISLTPFKISGTVINCN